MNVKMTRTDMNIHFKHYKIELKIAIYLKYTNVVKFKKFLRHAHSGFMFKVTRQRDVLRAKSKF
jgi:hypothetical protein